MRYLVLVYEDAGARPGRLAGGLEELEAACRDNDAALRQSGYLLAAEHLAREAVATTVRVSPTTVSVGEGAAGLAPGQLRAVLTLQARDLNEAIQVVATMPQARLGPVEVWALQGC
jgi:hypothetical protein